MTRAVPARYFLTALRAIVLKGVGVALADVGGVEGGADAGEDAAADERRGLQRHVVGAGLLRFRPL